MARKTNQICMVKHNYSVTEIRKMTATSILHINLLRLLIIFSFIQIIAPHLSSIEALEKYDTDRPDVHLIGDLWRLFTHHKTLRG